MRPVKHVNVLGLGVLLILQVLFSPQVNAQEYILLGWNDLGMHCANQDFSQIAVLPPFNNVRAQLILKRAGQPPQVVTKGYRIEYSIPNNTYSVGKTNFWTYAQKLFGLASPLPPNVGLTGRGLTGVMDTAGNYFEAKGIPVTPFPDSDLVHESPYQLVHLVARTDTGSTILATTDAVIPVSNEVGCVQSGCHTSASAILAGHDDASGFNANGPVLCASCHASNALGTTGIPEAMPFSYRIHEKHQEVAGAANAIETCYKCHPGPRTQCLRDVMGKNPTNPLVCQNCHGTMQNVAQSILNGRSPWLNEPQCGNVTCHGSTYAEEAGKLFRQSEGHGGLFCSACHGSPHAIQPTVQPNDNLQNTRLQGFAGALKKCTVCHETTPSSGGPHGLMFTDVLPDVPSLTAPPNLSVGIPISMLLRWDVSNHADSYMLEVATDSLFTSIAAADSGLTITSYQVTSLTTGVTYYWHVRAMNVLGPSNWSQAWSFTVAVGTTYQSLVSQGWNMVSLPAAVVNPMKSTQYPTANSRASFYDPLVGYSLTDSLHPGVGYWIRFPAAGSVAITGAPIMSDTINVVAGWNMIGSTSQPVVAASIASDPPGIRVGNFFMYAGGYKIADTLLPGRAYWVKGDQSGKLILGGGPSSLQSVITIVSLPELPPPPPQDGEVSGDRNVQIPTDYSLSQNYPNPFNPVTRIDYRLPSESKISLRIYNVLGQLAAVLADGVESAGYKTAEWNASGSVSGIYFYRLDAVSVADPDMTFTQMKKMILIR